MEKLINKIVLKFKGSKNPASKKIYVECDSLVEKLSRFIYFAFLYVNLPAFVLPKSIHSYVIYFTTDSGRDAFALPFEMWQVFNLMCPFFSFVFIIFHQSFVFYLGVDQNRAKSHWRFPFGWKNPYGYFIATAFQTILIIRLLHYIACIASLALASFLFAFAFTKDLNKNLHSFNEAVKAKQSEADIFKEFTELISIHSRLRQLSWILNWCANKKQL